MRAWAARALIGVVFTFNVQCALAFLIAPGAYAPGFELSGAAGEAMVRGLGVLFLMWNVPYLVALWHPVRHRTSLYEAVAMQAIGVVGESLILSALPGAHPATRATILRFVAFDGAGLLALVLAAWIARGLGCPRLQASEALAAPEAGSAPERAQIGQIEPRLGLCVRRSL